MSTNKTDYILESPEEAKRLSNQHNVIKDSMRPHGLILAPIDLAGSPLRILDSATADGTWLRDLASTTPTPHTLIGTDIDPSNFPASPSPNETYLVQDILSPWPSTWTSSFDMVHQRLALAAGGPAQPTIVANLAALLKPGAWMQLMEATNILDADTTGPAFRDFVAIMRAVFRAFGGSETPGEELVRWVQSAGLVDVEEMVVETKLGARNPDKGLADEGVYSTGVAARGLAAFATSLPDGKVPLEKERIEDMPERLIKELREVGAVYPLRVVWGRRPVE